jgi:2-hydroxyglutarate dehydrogenase
MYDYCQANNIAHRKTGKLVVAQEHQIPYIETLYKKTRELPYPPHSSLDKTGQPAVPARLIDKEEAHALAPDLSKKIVAALLSSETGIVDSHSLMESFQKDIKEADGELVFSTRVVRVDPHAGSPQAKGHSGEIAEDGWVVQMVTGDSQESDSLLARTLINASGLAGPMILNSLLPMERRIPMYFAKGSYATYRGPGVSRVSHLIYPSGGTGRTLHTFQSLGTHLTLDLDGNIRFGPDIDWLNPPPVEHLDDGTEIADPDFWTRYLNPNESRLPMMHEAITEYLESIKLDGLQPDYCGIRPKLVGPEGGFQDFVFRTDHPENFPSSAKRVTRHRRDSSPMITLMGIESPGLTSSLAIAEMVVDDMLCTEEGHN